MVIISFIRFLAGAEHGTVESDKIILSYISPYYSGVNAANKVGVKLWDIADIDSVEQSAKRRLYVDKYDDVIKNNAKPMVDALVGTRDECLKRGQSYQLEGSTYRFTLNDDVCQIMQSARYEKDEDN